jgi:Mg-chelatase subunit ChlD
VDQADTRKVGALRACGASAALGALFALAAAADAREPRELRDLVAPEPGHIELSVEYPPDDSVVNQSACGIFVAGRALAVQGETPRLDVVIVLDTSRSTSEPTGVDLDGDGVVGEPILAREGPIFIERNSDPDDSVLAAEVAAARLILRGLDPRRTRLSVVTFAGEAADARRPQGAHPSSEPATTAAPLTSDHTRVGLALADVLAGEPSGSTDMAAGLDLATRELAADAGREKFVIFFTDGQPTLPHGPARELENILAVFDAADRAARAGVRIHSFAVGADALEGPLAVVEMATRTGGSFTAVPDPGDLPQLMRDLHFTRLRDVAVRNATTGTDAYLFRLAADGSWIGFLQLEPGPNRIELVARADWGADASRDLEVRLDPAKPAPELLPMFVVQRNELLEICLEQHKKLRLDLEKRARKYLELEVERTRKELRLEIERARAKARKRAGEQRKELRIWVEPAASEQ